MHPRLASLLVIAAVLVAGGCAGSDARPPQSATDPATTAPTVISMPDRPPAVRLVVDGRELPAAQGSFCWTSSDGAGGCEDKVAFPVSGLPDAGSTPSVELRFPLPDAHFTALLRPVANDDRSYRGRVTDLGEGRYELTAEAPPDRYHVYVLGRLDAGEAPGEFLWTVPLRR